MRVLFYTPFFLPQSQAAAVRSYWLVQTLKEEGHKVQVLSSIQTPESIKLIFNPADNKQTFIKRMIYEIFAGIELFTRILISKSDLYILSSPPFITNYIGHMSCRLKNAKYVVDVRDIYPDVYFMQGLIKENSFVGKIAKALTKSLYKNAHGVLSVTPGLVEKIKMLSPASRVELLINGYDKNAFKPSTEKFNKFTVMFHGNMGRVQNIPVILKVAELLINDEIEFVFIGDGLQASLFEGEIPKNVKYLGPKNYSDIPEIVSKAHVGFSARSDTEIGADAFPVKVFEYLGVEIPVIMTPKSGVMSRMVESGIYEFDNSAVLEIADKIRGIKEHGGKVKLTEDLSRQEVSKKILMFCDFN